MKGLFTISIFIFFWVSNVKAQDGQSADSSEQVSDSTAIVIDSLARSIKFQQGTFKLSDNLASVNTEGGFAFFDSKDANTLLSKLWNNPEDPDVLGMLVPSDMSPLDEEFWGVVYSYSEDGHVSDKDADEIKYDELLVSMKQSTEDANPSRLKDGFVPLHLAGWAQPPYYDKASHKLHWAKDLITGDDSLHTLNYNIRMLGRKGVLVLNVVASMDQLPLIKQKIENIMASTNFTSGNRYEDFIAGTDKIAEYGIATLIAGGVLAKTGVLAKIGIFLVKAWKVIALVIVGALGTFKKFFKKSKKEPTDNTPV